MLWRIRNSLEQSVYNRFYARYVDVADTISMVTFTFDDFPDTAFYKGGKLLEKCGARGTFYLAPGLCGQVTDVGKIIPRNDIRKFNNAGHELACHTYSHLDCRVAKKNEIIDDITKANQEFGDIIMENFSFPFGSCDAKSRRIVGDYFKSCRGIQGGVNQGKIDILDLKANAIYSKNSNCEKLLQKIKDVKKYGGWLIFYTHDVSSHPSPFGCTEEDLSYLIDAVIERDIPITTVKEALARLL